jgi:hypothetical protein
MTKTFKKSFFQKDMPSIQVVAAFFFKIKKNCV